MKADTSSNQVGFTATQWITNGGSAISTDNDPNSVAPTAARIITVPSNILLATFAPNSSNQIGTAFAVYAADATSCTVRPWWYDDAQSTWQVLSPTLTLTYASSNVQAFTLRCMPGVKLFLQVVTNNGVTKIAVVVR